MHNTYNSLIRNLITIYVLRVCFVENKNTPRLDKKQATLFFE